MAIIQPCVRLRYSKNLHEVNGFEAAMAVQESKEISVYHGNSLLLRDIIRTSGARLHLAKEVVNITTGTERRYRIHIIDGSEAMLSEDLEFDVVILALDSFGLKVIRSLDVNSGLDRNTSSYVSTHVTRCATTTVLSLDRLSPGMNGSSPDRLLTTPDGLQQPDIFAIERSKTIYSRAWRWARAVDREPIYDDDCANGDMGEEYIYRIVSRYRIEDEMLSGMFSRDKLNDEQMAEKSLLPLFALRWAMSPNSGKQIWKST